MNTAEKEKTANGVIYIDSFVHNNNLKLKFRIVDGKGNGVSSEFAMFSNEADASDKVTRVYVSDWEVDSRTDIVSPNESSSTIVNDDCALDIDKYNEFKALLIKDDSDFGCESDVSQYLMNQLAISKLQTNLIVHRAYQDFADKNSIMHSLVNALIHFEYRCFKPFGAALVLAILKGGDDLLKEHTISLIDYWDDPDLLPGLRSYKPTSIWMRRLVTKVMRRLENK